MSRKILIVEYDSPTIEDLTAVFPQPHFDLDIAEDGMAARDLLKKNRYDLVVTAAMLPKFHGFNLSQLIGKEYPDTKIIVISGVYKGIEYQEQAVNQYGATDFFEKPLDINKLKQRVFQLLKIDPEELKDEGGGPKTTVPDTSTKKIHRPKFRKDQEGLSSEEMFGDIIQEVEGSGRETGGPGGQPASRKIKKDPRKSIEEEISRKFEETLSGLGLSGKMGRVTTPKPPPSVQPEPQKKTRQEKAKPEPVVTKKREEEQAQPRGGPVPPRQPKPGEPEKKEPEGLEKKPPESRKEAYGYDILGLIARGGMAELYKARKHGVKGFEKIIALKKILTGYGEDDKFIEMFVDEAKIAAELTHPNIVQIYDLGKEDNNYFIAMEYVEGTDLRMLLRKYKELDRPFPEEIAIYIVIKILNALEYAHSAKNSRGTSLNIVHRDISPPNILLSYSGEVKLTDFGVSKASIKMHQTVSGSLKGKLLYMSPEQSQGDQSVDSRADLFATGIILYEMLTGIKPFLAASEMGVLKKLQNVDCPAPREINKNLDPRLEKIILKALNQDKEQRYQTAEEMSKDLESYVENSFNIVPNFTHLAYLLSSIFEEEIKEKGIKIKQKFKPKPIQKKTPPPPPVAEEPEPEEPEKSPSQKEKELLLLQEEFEPAVEIDLEKKKEEAEDESPAGDSEIDTGIYDELAKEERKGRKGLLITLILAAVGVGGYFLYTQLIAPALKSRPLPAQARVTQGERSPGETLSLPDEAKGTETQLNQDIQQLAGEESGPLKPDSDQTEPDPAVEEPSAKKETRPGKTDSSSRISQARTDTPRKKETPKPVTGNKEEKATDRVQQKMAKEPGTRDEPKAPESRSKKEEPPVEQTPSGQQEETVSPKTELPPPEIRKPEPKIEEGMIIPLNEVNVRPLLIEKVLPEIKPKQKRELRYNQETVEVRFLVNHLGRVERVQLLSGSSSLEINLIVTSAVKNWRYQPGIKDNKKVKVWLTEKFKINKN